MSAPASVHALRRDLAAPGSLKPEKSPAGRDVLVTSTTMSGLIACAPATKPASNFSISGRLDAADEADAAGLALHAAATPARKEPCSSAKSRPVRLSAPRSSTEVSTIANWVSG